MRIAELSRRSGVPVPTIKYYLREGLLPSGALTSPNQADYDEHHLRRLRLIRALVDLGGVSLGVVRVVLDALASDTMSLHDRLGAAHRAVTPGPPVAAGDADREVAAAHVRELLAARGWRVEPDGPAVGTLIETVAALRALGQDHLVGHLDDYAEAVEHLAELEVAAVLSREDPEQIAESVVIGTILGERLVAALRLLAHENASARLLGRGEPR